jgi:hypothetical protein
MRTGTPSFMHRAGSPNVDSTHRKYISDARLRLTRHRTFCWDAYRAPRHTAAHAIRPMNQIRSVHRPLISLLGTIRAD